MASAGVGLSGEGLLEMLELHVFLSGDLHFKFSKKRREASDVSESLTTVMTFKLKMLFLISLDTHPYRNDLPEPLGK